ncbi:DUF6894 family protein [Microvirga roseola]|uniref:DUF6894 family protein n=1 Tax=Microvirga roseola TaxID=2883126 RepID=UPI001E3927D3|nr:hypothetical protein [Microvirga roseola]
MPRYFFNVQIGEDVVSDPDGRELPDADAAWEAARGLALDLMGSALPRPVSWASCHVEVRDEADEIVLEFPFVEAIQTPR